ncbi:MAG: MFS transporter [Bacilli bacterium]|nr:MFS transporter [Bacilli bacterium]
MRLKYKQTFYIGLAFLSIMMFWQVYDSIIPKILVNSFGMNQTMSGIIMSLDNIFALFLLPIFGHLSDKTSTRFGKRTPYIIIGTFLVAAFVAILAIINGLQISYLQANGIEQIVKEDFIVNGQLDEAAYQAALAIRQSEVHRLTMNNIYYLIAFIGALLLILISISIYRTPAIALMPDVTPKPLQSRANAIINFMGSTGGILALALMSIYAQDYSSYVPLFLILTVVMIILLIIFLININERKILDHLDDNNYLYDTSYDNALETDFKMDKHVKRSFILLLLSVVFWYMGYNAAFTKFSIYTQNVLGMNFTLPLIIAQITALVSFIPLGIFATKIGRRQSIIFGASVLTISFMCAYFINANNIIYLYLTMGMAGIGWATISVNSYPMVVELARGNNIGKYTGYYYISSMLAQIVTPILSGFLMDNFSMKVLFPYSAICCSLSLISMFFVKHGDSKPSKKHTKLEGFEDE